MNSLRNYIVSLLVVLGVSVNATPKTHFKDDVKKVLYSPNKQLKLVLYLDRDGVPLYSVYYKNSALLDSSRLGFNTVDANMNADFSSINVGKTVSKQDVYQTKNGKRYNNYYQYNATDCDIVDGAKKMSIQFRISNNGVAFRYYIPTKGNATVEVLDELTSYHFPSETKAFLQPVAVAKSGWEATNPSYEENYVQDVPVGTPEPTRTGWVYPALFHRGNAWIAITEAGLDGSYCATRLSAQSPNGNYKVTFPEHEGNHCR